MIAYYEKEIISDVREGILDSGLTKKSVCVTIMRVICTGREISMNKKWTLHVENFAKIISVDVTIAPLMCFVGDNNSGKSYLMSVLWGILTLGKDIFPKKPSEAKVYKQCEEWLLSLIHISEPTRP